MLGGGSRRGKLKLTALIVGQSGRQGLEEPTPLVMMS
jgi:hypothetical protein